MILPTKHTNFSESLLGFGSYILRKMAKANTVDALWNQYQKDYESKKYLAKQSFDNLLLTLIFLHTIGAIDELDGGLIKCD